MSDFLDRLDPELRGMNEGDRPSIFDVLKSDVNAGRAEFAKIIAEITADLPPFEGQKDEYHISGLENDPEVPVVEYRERDVLYPDCTIIWLHGGGYLIGSADDISAQSFSPLAPVVSVDYRMAPEHRARAAARDVCAVEFIIFPGAPHGFNGFMPQAAVSQRANASIRLALEHALK